MVLTMYSNSYGHKNSFKTKPRKRTNEKKLDTYQASYPGEILVFVCPDCVPVSPSNVMPIWMNKKDISTLVWVTCQIVFYHHQDSRCLLSLLFPIKNCQLNARKMCHEKILSTASVYCNDCL